MLEFLEFVTILIELIFFACVTSRVLTFFARPKVGDF